MFGATKAALGSMAEAFHFETFSLGIDTTVVQAGIVAMEVRENIQESARQSVTGKYGAGSDGEGIRGNLGPMMASPVAAKPEEIATLVSGLISSARREAASPTDRRALG